MSDNESHAEYIQRQRAAHSTIYGATASSSLGVVDDTTDEAIIARVTRIWDAYQSGAGRVETLDAIAHVMRARDKRAPGRVLSFVFRAEVDWAKLSEFAGRVESLEDICRDFHIQDVSSPMRGNHG